MASVSSMPANRTTGVAFGVWVMLCGLVLVLWPAATTRVLVVFVGLGAVSYGVTELLRVYSGTGQNLELWAGLVGLVNIFGGVVIVITPFVSTSAAGVVVGLYWLAGGIVEIAGALLRPDGRLVRFPIGVLSAALGGVVLAVPTMSILILVWLAGAWLMAMGLVLLLAGFIAKSAGTSAAAA
ncbi:MAG: hypothetical protein EA388_06435 [Nitriliruptor sp.]|nr:MAG: hypothetical protein EA388_06435 [Nitriliruptor sp.]